MHNLCVVCEHARQKRSGYTWFCPEQFHKCAPLPSRPNIPPISLTLPPPPQKTHFKTTTTTTTTTTKLISNTYTYIRIHTHTHMCACTHTHTHTHTHTPNLNKLTLTCTFHRGRWLGSIPAAPLAWGLAPRPLCVAAATTPELAASGVPAGEHISLAPQGTAPAPSDRPFCSSDLQGKPLHAWHSQCFVQKYPLWCVTAVIATEALALFPGERNSFSLKN